MLAVFKLSALLATGLGYVVNIQLKKDRNAEFLS
jgi:hypothetical protein